RKANDSHADCYQYFCVPEYGTANGRLHFHAVHFMRTLPTGSVDPNFGRRVRNRQDRKSGSAGMPRPISYAVFCLKKKKYGDATSARVIIYMPMVPAAAVALLACARLGAVHSVISGGLAATAFAALIDDAYSN